MNGASVGFDGLKIALASWIDRALLRSDQVLLVLEGAYALAGKPTW